MPSKQTRKAVFPSTFVKSTDKQGTCDSFRYSLHIIVYLCVCRLRVRIKTMQQLVDGQSERLACLQAVKEASNLRHQDESTGQGLVSAHTCTHTLVRCM